MFTRITALIFTLYVMAVIFGEFVDRFEPTTLTLNVQRAIVAGVLVGDFSLTILLAPLLFLVAGSFAFEGFCAFIGAGSWVLMARNGSAWHTTILMGLSTVNAFM